MFTVTKTYRDLPAAHRAHAHDGHCRLIHGHNFGFDIVFGCAEVDKNGFVIDIGELDWLKQWLNTTFDHTLLLNQDDPWLPFLNFHLEDVTDPQRPLNGCVELAKIVVVPNCGMEGLAQFVYQKIEQVLNAEVDYVERGVTVLSVTCREDSKNAATYR